MELHRRDKDLGQAGQMLPLTPRGDSADYQARPRLLPQHNVCLLKKNDVSGGPVQTEYRRSSGYPTQNRLRNLSQALCADLRRRRCNIH